MRGILETTNAGTVSALQNLYTECKEILRMSSDIIITDSEIRYRDKRGNMMRSRTELSIARMLEFLQIPYEYDVVIDAETQLRVDFKTDRGLIEIINNDADLARFDRIRSIAHDQKVIAMGRPQHVARTEEMSDIAFYDAKPDTGSIFLEDPSFAFDYAHILPLVKKCSILHGHTSSIMVELVGQMKDNLLLDFGEAKRIIKNVISVFDHKFFINSQYLKSQNDTHYHIQFDGPRGEFDLHVPIDTTYMLDGEATVENLATEIIKLLSPKLPENIEAVGVYIYEGYGKGSHIISKIAR